MKGGPSFSRLLEPILEPARLFRAPGAYARHLRHRRLYQQHSAAERLRWRDEYPQLWDRLPSSPYDPHYFFQDTWAAQRIAEARPKRHVDIGSRVDFVGFLTALAKVTFVDIRPLAIELEGLTCVEGNILALPFEDGTIPSASCLHVAEHIGLGRTETSSILRGLSEPLASLHGWLRPEAGFYSRCPSASRASSSMHTESTIPRRLSRCLMI